MAIDVPGTGGHCPIGPSEIRSPRLAPILPTEISRKTTKCCTSASESAKRTGSPSAVAASTSSALLSGAGPPCACRTSGYLTAPISSRSSMSAVTLPPSLYIMGYIVTPSNGVGGRTCCNPRGSPDDTERRRAISRERRPLFDRLHRDLHIERPRGIGRRGDDHVGARAGVIGGVGGIDPSRGGDERTRRAAFAVPPQGRDVGGRGLVELHDVGTGIGDRHRLGERVRLDHDLLFGRTPAQALDDRRKRCLASEFPMLGEDEYGLGQAKAMGNRTAAENGLDRQGAGSRQAI